MKREKFFGILFMIFSLGVLSTNLQFTGAVVGISSGSLNIIALVFLVVGSALFLHGNNLEDLARKTMQASPKEIARIAHKMGYEGKEAKEGLELYNRQGKIVTVIPHHNISSGVHYQIRKALLTGESNFRQRYSN